MSRRGGTLLLVIVLSLLAACQRRTVQLPSTPPGTAATFLNLQSGWRLRLVVPITKSGATEALFRSQTTLGNTITLVASDDLLGYETQYFALRGREKLRLRFSSAFVTIDGRARSEPSPRRKILPLPARPEFLCLLFLQRVSAADHDMALIGADSSDNLRRKTEEVRADAGQCAVSQKDFCAWIPKGVAVIAERRVETEGRVAWEPAQ